MANNKTVEIGWADDSTPNQYSLAIREAKDLAQLKKIIEFYQPLTIDAQQRVSKMSAKDFQDFKKDAKLALRARGKVAELIVDRWGDILMPKTMLEVSILASNFGAPFGTAYNRLLEMREIKK